VILNELTIGGIHGEWRSKRTGQRAAGATATAMGIHPAECLASSGRAPGKLVCRFVPHCPGARTDRRAAGRWECRTDATAPIPRSV